MILQSPVQLAAMIDHTLLDAAAMEADIRKLCRQAAEYRFAAVCVTARWISLAADLLRDSGTRAMAFRWERFRAIVPEAEELIMAGADRWIWLPIWRRSLQEMNARKDIQAVQICRMIATLKV